ncbi:hypothetical protein PQI07_27865 [Methylobacterium sp. 092160098-2]|uniref:hypothetical protein n=1 Tax=Methylobacterium sp. 092160098-2 TaxID=3025129 RepID=UPI002381C83F|nr:hypothetical protein [Methylobacterium sp. 092160098-2]MDE4914485.1 hypothetical protein [Methylobacterium sp. 092160098-2]
MMKTIASALALCLAASAAQAAEGAWNSAGSAGTYEYSVTNRDGATLRVVNASGSGGEGGGPECYVTFEKDGQKLPPSYRMSVDAGGETFVFAMKDGNSTGDAKTDREQLFGLVGKLVTSKKPTFSVAVQGAKYAFPTKNAAKALNDALDGCN